jgi:glycosyltransferase involved in cell wall biosynthesis
MTLILHIITGLEDGGAEAVLFRLTTADTAHRHTVVSLGDGGKYGPLLEAQGVRVQTLGMPRGRVTLAGLYKLVGILRREQPRIVQTWMYHANLVGGVVARLSGVSAVFWSIHHTDLLPGTTGASTRLVDWLCARLSPLVPKGIIACALEAQRVHIANGYAARKFSVIPNGYDVALFAPDAQAGARIRAELGIADQSPVVGLVGRWDPQKDHANLIAALQTVRLTYPDVAVVLAGTRCEPDNVDLAALLRAAGLDRNVHLLGRRADIPAVMNALDLHVLSSYSEAFPNVVAEAMACGTPCVVTDIGDAALIVGQTGWVVPPKNSLALADAIVDALHERGDAGRWNSRTEAARERIVREFSLGTMVARYRKAWEQ